MQKFILNITLFVLTVLLCSSFQTERQVQIKTVLGIGVITAPNSRMYSFAEIQIRTSSNEVIGHKNITRDAFLKKGTGLWPSRANPNKVNLFEEHGVECFPIYDSILNKYTQFACSPLLDLWKLRWSKHPYQHFPGDEGNGWSQGQYKPSTAQQKYLWERYNNPNIMINYFYGEKMFELFKDMQDSVWILNYQQLADTLSK